ncbi:hypothetical protein A4R44_02141 [Amycolatopsis sp. M39]|nr:hypothetical protein A4R44_02141 [Amycolatopsis sp. M39]
MIGEPMRAGPEDSCEALTTDLRARMSELLEKAQAEYPEAPESDAERWWLPAHLGGSAPTPEEAAALDRRS